ncbi:hypothetical protein [Mucilaginibacter celer]|uniref:DUF4153 domain-containing protein n=1 Tax=Mucilaginibacter celer TaxID=2305508 RepID=A0A494VMY8_9SPHI|nr:hypothetical protein [Mucilaginibacter celer]AYL96716.1 hypothetical protein HYN43_016035 [Mucilaginibacter celer]
MRDQIIAHLNDAGYLEKMYRGNRGPFKKEFASLYPDVKGNALADFWNERLNYENDEISWGSSRELVLVILAALTAGLIAKLPAILSINQETFYSRNIGFIIFPLLTSYFAWKNKLSPSKIAFTAGAVFLGIIFINLLPQNNKSDTLILSCIHLVLFLWSVLGFAFVGGAQNDTDKRLSFLKVNGDVVVMTALIVIAGAIMTGVTIGLFSLIHFNIEKFYTQNIGIMGLAAAPIIATYLTQTNPQLVGKISPVIAKIFCPLVLITLVIYLFAMITSRENPYNNRDFLMIFNGVLLAVMAIIFFSVAESTGGNKSKVQTLILFLLSVVTIVVNGVALSAIVLRISEWGFSPNRTAVLGANVLIMVNLLLVTLQLFKAAFKQGEIGSVGKTISFYLPVYFVWVVIVTFVFPLVFGFR